MAGIGERGLLASCRPVRGVLLRDHCSPVCDCSCWLSVILPSIDNDYHLFCLIYVTGADPGDRKSTRLNSSHLVISYAVFCLKKKNNSAPVLFSHGCHLHQL